MINSMKAYPLLSVLLMITALNSSAQWIPTNGPHIVDINSILIHPNGHIFAAGSNGARNNGGIFRSTDDGGTWTREAYLFPRTLAVTRQGNILAGLAGSGIVRSVDDGGTWTPMDSGIAASSDISALLVTRTGDILAAAGQGIYRSTDDGLSWNNSGSGVYQGTNALATDSNGNIFAGTYLGGVYRSTDGGATWVQAISGLTGAVIWSLAVDPAGEIFAGSSISGVFRSTDTGTSWQTTGLANGKINVLLIDSAGTVHAGTEHGVYSSTDRGSTWVQSGLPFSTIFTLAIPKPGDMLAGTWFGGIYRSGGPGGSWRQIFSGFDPVETVSLGVSPQGDIYAGTPLGGIFRSPDNGSSWTEMVMSMTSFLSIAFDSSGDIFAAGTANKGTSGVFRLLAGQNSFSQVLIIPYGSPATKLAAGAEDELVAGTTDSGLYRSTDKGDHWTQIGFTDSTVRSVLLDSQGTIFAGIEDPNTEYGYLTRSTDHGAHWTGINDGFSYPYPTIWAMAVNARGELFAGVWSSIAGDAGIYRSTNSGQTWVSSNAGLPNPAPVISAFAIGSQGNIFASTMGNGVFRSTDDGAHWARMNSGLMDSVVTSLALDTAGYVYAGLQYPGFGVYRTVLSTAVGSEPEIPPASTVLGQNYPNPFNPSTTIRYHIPEQRHITLKLYDLLGREMATLVDRVEAPGDKFITLQAGNIPSGVYYYRLRAGNFIGTRKLIVIR